MKKSYLLLLLLLLFACGTPYRMQDFYSRKVDFYDSKVDFQLKDDKIMIKTVVNNDTLWAQFDSKFTSDIIYLNAEKSLDKYYEIEVKSTFGYEIYSYKKYMPTIATSIFKIENSIGIELLNKKVNACDSLVQYILGLPVFLNQKYLYFPSLNFTNQTISFESKLPINTNEYIPLDISYYNQELFVILTLNGVTSKFLFDTGNDGFVMVKNKEFKLKKNHTSTLNLSGQLMPTLVNTNISNMNIYENVKFKELNKFSIDHTIIESDEIVENSIGLKFIENFDWFFDFKKGIVYVKPIQSKDKNNDFKYNKFKISIINNKPQFVYKESSNKSIILFKPIIKINEFDLKDLMTCEELKIINKMDINAITSIVYE